MRISVFAYMRIFIVILLLGTEELNQLCEDILAFRRDTAELKRKENQKKEEEEMRKAVVERLVS